MNAKKITICQASDRKGNLCILENMSFPASKRNSFSDSYKHLDSEDGYFTGLGKTFLFPK